MPKVKFLKHVPPYEPGQVVDVSDAEAAIFCKESEVSDGHKLVKFKKAILLSDAIKLKEAKVDVSKLTAADMAELGMKNIVHTPQSETDKLVAYAKKVGAALPDGHPDKKVKGGKAQPQEKQEDEKADS